MDFFATHGGEWEVKAQLCTNLESMPIEDASVAWPEDESPYVTVARIVAEPQAAWSHERSRTVDDGMAFNPWHGLAGASTPRIDQPRAQAGLRDVEALRAAHNGVTIDEPAMGPVLD